jgi:hypothetical protein
LITPTPRGDWLAEALTSPDQLLLCVRASVRAHPVQLCNQRFRAPWWGLMKALQSPSERTIQAEVRIMRDFALEIVRGRRRELSDGQQLGPDLLSRFLTAAAKNGEVCTDATRTRTRTHTHTHAHAQAHACACIIMRGGWLCVGAHQRGVWWGCLPWGRS